MITHVLLIVALIIIFLFKNSSVKKIRVAYPELSRKADLLALSHDVEEIKAFANAKIDYLDDVSYNKLLSRIEELEADRIIYEDQRDSKVNELQERIAQIKRER